MTGARFVHDTLERLGWEVLIADAQKVKGLAPLAVKTDRIDARVLAVLSQRDLVQAIWLPDPRVRRERELARFRLHLVKHRFAAEEPDPLGAAMISFGRPCRSPTSSGWQDGSCSLKLDLPEPWRGNIDASLALIDDLEAQIDEVERRGWPRSAREEDRPPRPLLLTDCGMWLGRFALAVGAQIGEIERFPSPREADRLHRALPAGDPIG